MSRNSFLTPLKVEVMDTGKTFKLTHSFIQRSRKFKVAVQVQRGFVTDFASIPRGARLIIPKLGKHTKASVPHDMLYRNHVYKVPGSPSLTYVWKRKQVDELFLEGMLDLSVDEWKAKAMFWAVRLFGWLAWRKAPEKVHCNGQ